MLFNNYTNPKEFLKIKFNESKDQGVPNSNNTKADTSSANSDALITDNDDDKVSASAKIINRYNPDKNLAENTRHWLPETSKAVSDYMDLRDYNTLNVISAMNEAE